MPEITFTRGKTFVVAMDDGTTEEHQMIEPSIDRERKALLEWEAAVPDEIVAEHIAWLNRRGLLRPA